jgi:hypothetical protein
MNVFQFDKNCILNQKSFNILKFLNKKKNKTNKILIYG